MHSESIAIIKSVKESIPDNYTSKQLISILDTLLMRAIVPIIRNTNLIDRILASILVWNSKARKRCISFDSKENLTKNILRYLISDNVDNKIKIYSSLKLERNISFSILTHFCNITKDYKKYAVDVIKHNTNISNLESIELKMGVSGDLWVTIQEVSIWQKQAITFRNQLIEKYMRHAVNRAACIFMKYSHYVDPDDLIQNYIISIGRAIDKYDPDKGTLTSYINHWFKDASSNPTHTVKFHVKPISHITGEVIEEIGDQIVENDSSSLDDSEITFIRFLAKYADPSGFARMDLSIQEILTNDEIDLLKL